MNQYFASDNHFDQYAVERNSHSLFLAWNDQMKTWMNKYAKYNFMQTEAIKDLRKTAEDTISFGTHYKSAYVYFIGKDRKWPFT